MADDIGGDALHRVFQADIDLIEAALDAELVLHRPSQDDGFERVTGIEAGHRAAVELAELITVYRVIEKVGEVIVEIQI